MNTEIKTTQARERYDVTLVSDDVIAQVRVTARGRHRASKSAIHLAQLARPDRIFVVGDLRKIG